MKCLFCKEDGITKNRSGTEFCRNCHYYATRMGNDGRLPGHPKFEELGYKIKREHPDFHIKYKPRKKGWVRNE